MPALAAEYTHAEPQKEAEGREEGHRQEEWTYSVVLKVGGVGSIVCVKS